MQTNLNAIISYSFLLLYVKLRFCIFSFIFETSYGFLTDYVHLSLFLDLSILPISYLVRKFSVKPSYCMFRLSLGVVFPQLHIDILEGEKIEETVATCYDAVAAMMWLLVECLEEFFLFYLTSVPQRTFPRKPKSVSSWNGIHCSIMRYTVVYHLRLHPTPFIGC